MKHTIINEMYAHISITVIVNTSPKARLQMNKANFYNDVFFLQELSNQSGEAFANFLYLIIEE